MVEGGPLPRFIPGWLARFASGVCWLSDVAHNGRRDPQTQRFAHEIIQQRSFLRQVGLVQLAVLDCELDRCNGVEQSGIVDEVGQGPESQRATL